MEVKEYDVGFQQKIIVHIYTDYMSMWYREGYVEYRYMDHDDIENADKYIAQACAQIKNGYLQCTYCGKWIKKSEAHHMVPAGCSCDDCLKEAHEDEKEFLRGLD